MTFVTVARRAIREGRALVARFPAYRAQYLAILRNADEFRCYLDSDGVCDCGSEGRDRHAARMLFWREYARRTDAAPTRLDERD